MEMTLQRLGLETYRPLIKGMVMPIGILALVAMMVLPFRYSFWIPSLYQTFLSRFSC